MGITLFVIKEIEADGVNPASALSGFSATALCAMKGVYETIPGITPGLCRGRFFVTFW
ncbi:hypothetical protein HPY86_06380 [candidate division WOR-3 bacterium]|nr:hypothetical protein [candidate division WOR-3 bacterium]